MPYKATVEVTALFDMEGKITPLSVRWKDGTEYEIDRILDVRKAASTKVGGIGTRYTVMIRGHQTYLWFEDPCWFVEAKNRK